MTRSSSSDFPESTERAVRAERAHGRAAAAGPAGRAPPSPGATLQLSCSPVLSAPGDRVLPKGWDGPRQRGVPETGGRSEEQPPKGHRQAAPGGRDRLRTPRRSRERRGPGEESAQSTALPCGREGGRCPALPGRPGAYLGRGAARVPAQPPPADTDRQRARHGTRRTRPLRRAPERRDET